MEFGPPIQREIYDFLVASVNSVYLYTYSLVFQVMDDEERVMLCVSQAPFRKKLYQKMVFLVRMSQPLQYLMG